MATQLKDGSFTETESFDKAIERFVDLAESGQAKAFFCGSKGEVDKAKKEAALGKRIDELESRLADLEADKSQIIDKPTPSEIERFGN